MREVADGSDATADRSDAPFVEDSAVAKLPYFLIIALAFLLAPLAAGQTTLADQIAAVKKQRAEEAAKGRKGSVKLELLQALFYTDLTVEFTEAPARDVFEYLKTALGVNLIVRSSDEPIGHGIDPETPITLKVEKMPAVEVLELVLEQCATIEECTWQLRKSFIEVGTKERLSVPATRELRTYPINDLLYEPPRFDDAPPIGFWDDYYWSDGYTRSTIGGYPGAYRYGPYYGGGYGGYGGARGYGGSFGPGVSSGASRSHVDPNSPEKQAERALEIIDLIITQVDPPAWADNGGEWATIQYREGALLVRAPEYIHRQIGGYGRIPPPKAPEPGPAAGGAEPSEP